MSDVAEPVSIHPSRQVVLEGWLLKRSSYRRGWNNRYFVLKANELSYFEGSDDPKPKGTFLLSQSGCSVSDIYLHQRQKDKSIIYCFKLAWWAEKGSKAETKIDASTAGESLQVADTATPQRKASLSRGRDKANSTAKKTHHRSPSEPRRVGGLVRDGPPDISLSDSLPSELLALSLTDGRHSESRPISPAAAATAVSKPTTVSRRAISLPPRHPAPRRTAPLSASVSAPRSPGSSELGSTNAADEKAAPKAGTQSFSQELPSTPSNEQEQLVMQSEFKANKKATQKKKRKKMVKGGKIAAAAGAAVGVGVVTAGVGLVAGLLVLGAGAAAGGTGVAAEHQMKRKKSKGLILASADYEDIKRWKAILEACIAAETVTDSTWGQMFAMEGRNTTTIMLPTTPRIATALNTDSGTPGEERRRNYRLVDVSTKRQESSSSYWRPMEGGWAALLGAGVQGLRILREEREQGSLPVRQRIQGVLSLKSAPCPPMKAQVILNSSPLNAFMCLMSLNRVPSFAAFETPLSGQRASFRVIDSIDDHMDVIHVIFRPLFLFPSWTAPRDFVLFRYWRLQDDGTYLVCYDSVEHRECPPRPHHVRGEMHAVYTVAPRKETRKKSNGTAPPTSNSEAPQCLLTAVVQVEPRGWVPTSPLPPLGNQGYADAFSVSTLLQILDIKDALDHDRFVSMGMRHPLFSEDFPLPFTTKAPRTAEGPAKPGIPIAEEVLRPIGSFEDPDYDFTYSERESAGASLVPSGGVGITSIPPCLTEERWAEPDANSFRVRGKSYIKDGKKVNAGSSLGRLIAVDVVQVAKNFFSGFCKHPEERMQRALVRDRERLEKGLASELPPFIFCVNVCLPGPPCYHGVFYYAIDDMSTIDGSNGTPESKLAKEFIFGKCDKMRDKTFKLIPQIVQGNFLVKKAVGSTPAIMGDKLRQLYVRGDNFFEVVLDCGSSSVAAGVIRLALGYAKTMVIDMGFVLEGYNEETLPEKIMGCTRIKNLEFGPHLRFVSPPKDS